MPPIRLRRSFVDVRPTWGSPELHTILQEGFVTRLVGKMSTEQVTAQVVNDFKQWIEQNENGAVAVAAIRALTTVSTPYRIPVS